MGYYADYVIDNYDYEPYEYEHGVYNTVEYYTYKYIIITKETEKAWLITFINGDAWVPKSVGINITNSIDLPDWFNRTYINVVKEIKLGDIK